MRTPTEKTYDIALGKCIRVAYLDPPDWCQNHESHYYEDAPFCDRRTNNQNTVEHVLKTMEGEDSDKAVIESQREMIRALTIELMKASALKEMEEENR